MWRGRVNNTPWGLGGAQSEGCGGLYNPPPSTPRCRLIPYAVWGCAGGCTLPAPSRCRHCAIVAPDVALSSTAWPWDLLMPQQGCGARGDRDGQRVARPLLRLHAAGRGTGPARSTLLTATGPSLPVQSPPTTPTSQRVKTPWKPPSLRSPSRTWRWLWGRRCCSSALSQPTPSQKVSNRGAGGGVGGASVAEGLSACPSHTH